ncbi:MAG TPA: ERCC4 domain-containing protein [Candidatus Binataceae bacterium]|jgi:hypothetical protein|nr:ERCC4 domain-containing protein [Candidatus Binataceae bacterium]
MVAVPQTSGSPAEITILIDTREQRPLSFGDLPTQRVELETGDYSCICDGKDLRDLVAIERKSVNNLGCIGGQRERFERKLVRLAQLPFRTLVIEGSTADPIDAVREVTCATCGNPFAWWST